MEYFYNPCFHCSAIVYPIILGKDLKSPYNSSMYTKGRVIKMEHPGIFSENLIIKMQ